jgi:hypothetical protein
LSSPLPTEESITRRLLQHPSGGLETSPTEILDLLGGELARGQGRGALEAGFEATLAAMAVA